MPATTTPVTTTPRAPVATPAVEALPPDVSARALREVSCAVSVADARLPDQPLVYVNPAFERVTGYLTEQVVGRNCRLLQGPSTRREDADDLRAAYREQRPGRALLLNYRPDGSTWWNELTVSPIRAADGKVTHWVGLQVDVTDRLQRDQRLDRLAHSDQLTGLPNRVRLREELAQALARAERSGRSVALLFIDLDGFKQVNDRYGHAAGDAVLGHVAQRLGHAVRATDLLSRHGGDEFVLVVADLLRGDEPRVCEAVSAQLQRALEAPIEVRSARVRLSASLGVAVYPRDAVDAASLLARADEAMYAAKRARG